LHWVSGEQAAHNSHAGHKDYASGEQELSIHFASNAVF
jgi:hypothetical protein